jgi:hypothetical protein
MQWLYRELLVPGRSCLFEEGLVHLENQPGQMVRYCVKQWRIYFSLLALQHPSRLWNLR